MAAQLEPELEAGLRRLKLRRVRELAPELCQTARTQRWRPEELLSALVREEIAACEASNLAARLKAARFPTGKALERFDPGASELRRATFDFLASLGSSAARTSASLGPRERGRAISAQLGRAACQAGHRVRFLVADELVEELHRGLADNSIGKLIAGLLRNDVVIIDDLGFTALDRIAAEHFFRFIAAAYERRSLIVSTNVSFERWTDFLPEETVATAILDRLLHHCHVIRLAGESYRLREARELVTPACGVPRIRPDRTILSVAGAARRAADRLHAPRFGPPGARHGRSWAKNVLRRPAARAPEGPSAPWCALVRARAAVSTQLRSPTAPSARCSPRPEAAASLRAWVGNFVATSGDSCWPLTDPLVVCLALRGGTSRGGITAGPSLGTSQPASPPAGGQAGQ